MIRELIAVGIGGAAGSAARYAISCWMLAGHTLLGFPAGTFAVNAAGSLLIGILLEAFRPPRPDGCSSRGSAAGSPPFRPFRPTPSACSAPGTTAPPPHTSS